MEIGHQQIGGLEAVAGRDEDVGLAGERPHGAVLAAAVSSSRSDGGADGDDASAGGARAIERGGGVGGDLAPFGVHAVVPPCPPP